MKHLAALLTVALVAVTTFVSCGQTCTLIGCQSGVHLRVRSFDGGAVPAFSGKIFFDGGAREFRCASGSTAGVWEICEDGGVFIGLLDPPPALQLAIVDAADAGRFDGLVPLSKPSPQFPNGEECGAACHTRQGDVTLSP